VGSKGRKSFLPDRAFKRRRCRNFNQRNAHPLPRPVPIGHQRLLHEFDRVDRLPFAFDFNVRTHFDVGPRPRFIYSRVRCFEGTLVTICSGSHFSVSAAFPMQGKTPVSLIHFDHDASNRSLYFSWPLRTYYGQHSILRVKAQSRAALSAPVWPPETMFGMCVLIVQRYLELFFE
jgi:hypothetical protein